MTVTLKPKSYGPLLLASANADHLAFTTEGGYQAAGVRTSQPGGLSPPDLLLASVGSCITISMRMAAEQMGLALGALATTARADKALDLPHRFARVTVDVACTDPLEPAVVDELARRTKALCTISNTLGAEVVLNLRTGSAAQAGPAA